MKAFTTACALIAGSASADSQFYNNGFIHHPIQTAYHPAVYGVHPQTTPLTYVPQAAALGRYYFNHPAMAVHPTLIKREAEAEPEFSYQSKVTHPEEKSAYEFRVNVDQMGNGRSYQHHQQMDSRMNQRNQMDNHRNQMIQMDSRMNQRNQMDSRMNQRNQMDTRMNQYNMDRHMSQMDQYMDSPRSRMNQMDMHRRNQMDSRMNQIDGHRMQYNMEQTRMNQINEMSREGDMFDRMMEQRQDSNMRDYMARKQQEGRNNMYSYERMLQRQNEARRMMNNQERRMFKREAEGSFEYDVTAEHSADNNRQMVIHPQQTYSMNQMDNRMNQRNQMDSRMNQRNQMDSRMNQMNQMDSRMNQMNQMDNRMNQYNMDSRMNRNQMMNNRFDSRMNRNQMMNNRFDSRMNRNQMMNNHFDSRMQYNMDNRMNNMEQRQFEQRQGMEGNTFGFDRASMQYFPSQFQQQQDQLRNYF